MIQIIKNKDRHFSDFGWLATHWHFSFAEYYDPANVQFGVLRVFNDDIIQGGGGFPTHPHKEMEIVTYVLEGALEHADSTGAAERIGAGEIQRMTAGTGIRHSEYNASKTQPAHLFQLWILPEKPGLPPSYEQKKFSREDHQGKIVPVVSGSGLPGTVKIHQNATIFLAGLRANQPLRHVLSANRRGYVFIIDGSLAVNGMKLEKGDQARITGETSLNFTGEGNAEFMLIDLP